MKRTSTFILLTLIGLMGISLTACDKKASDEKAEIKAPFMWENASIYFLLTDRFNNGDQTNDNIIERNHPTGKLRGFEGGDIKGITQKIKEGYFQKLGIDAIWFTPVVEQVHGFVDEGTGDTYAYHGYWAKDWTAIDPSFGTEADLEELIATAHANGIRIVMDVVINHRGPVTELDPSWPEEWARTEPKCTYDSYEKFTSCTLVENLPDVITDSDETVELPAALKEKWEKEGRLEQEMKELDEFFARTGYPRAPRFYIIKWLTDYVRKYGIDGYRVDTVKHTEAYVWGDLYKAAVQAFKDWKTANPEKVMDDNEFYMVGEVYGYSISHGLEYDNGGKIERYFDEGFNSLINFELIWNSKDMTYEESFSKYDSILNSTLKGKGVLNYLTSHDDSNPFDKERKMPFELATRLMLSPGAAQVYYGDETNRNLIVEGTVGDATLRSFMNWDELESNTERNGFKTQDVLAHWQKLGQFRQNHPAVGAGRHQMITEQPYTFKREYKSADYRDAVVAGLEMPKGKKEIAVDGAFANGTEVKDYYSGKTATVKDGKVVLDTEFDMVLLGK